MSDTHATALALKGAVTQFAVPKGADVLGRTDEFYAWWKARIDNACWPYFKALDARPSPETSISEYSGRAFFGLNFGNQDYLGLTSHPDVAEAAREALAEFGPHSAGSGMLLGNTRLSRTLEQEIADFLQVRDVLLTPTGWAAGYASIAGLLRPRDHVVLDHLSHACLQQGARACGAEVHFFAHNDVGALRELLATIRAEAPQAGIMAVTEGLFSMDSDSPDLRLTQETCHEFGATLLLDVAHDLGATGPGGAGQLGAQNMLGQVDLVMGSFSKTFCSNGGFIACNNPAVKQYLAVFGNPFMFSNALSPIQAAAVRAALAIVQSEEGDRLRASLLTASRALRDRFAELGIECLGNPSAIVPVPVRTRRLGDKGSDMIGRKACTLMAEKGLLTNLIEYPAVPRNFSRLRMQVMGTHTTEQAKRAAEIAVEAMEATAEELLAAGFIEE